MPAPTSTHAGPRAYSPTFPPGGRRQARRYTRWSAVVNELAKNNVSTRPRMPVALRMSSAEANASFAVTSAAPPIPSRCVRVEKIDVRTRCGANEATTITSGKNETNALPASATLRSTNSISSMRSHTRQSSVRSARSRMTIARWRAPATR